MKKTFVAGLLATLATAGLAAAQEAKAPRIAVIDMARVSAESLLGKTYAAQLEKLQNDINAEATKKQTELGKMDAAVKTLQDELEKQGAVLSQEARDRKLFTTLCPGFVRDAAEILEALLAEQTQPQRNSTKTADRR